MSLPTTLPRPATGHRATFAHALRAEWEKLFSLRSTAYTLLAFMVLTVGLTIAVSFATVEGYREASAAEQAEFPPLEVAVSSISVAILAIIVFGVLTVTGEYATGMIRPSLAAVPRRTRLLAAKAAVFTAVTLLVATVTGFATFFVSQAVLASQDIPYATLGDPHVLRVVPGFGLVVTLIGLVAVAVGSLLRSTAGAIATMVAGVLVLPNMAGLLPDWLAEQVVRFYPTLAASQLVMVEPAPGTLAPWAGFGVMAAFTAGLLAVAVVVFRQRDA